MKRIVMTAAAVGYTFIRHDVWEASQAMVIRDEAAGNPDRQGRFESAGVVQRIPGFGQQVEPVIRDGLVDGSWPKFLHPYPLSGKYFLVSMQPTPQSLWGIYLVDVFDNAVLLCEQPGYAMLEPVPFRATPRPPVIPDRTTPDSRDAIVALLTGSDTVTSHGDAGVGAQDRPAPDAASIADSGMSRSR